MNANVSRRATRRNRLKCSGSRSSPNVTACSSRLTASSILRRRPDATISVIVGPECVSRVFDIAGVRDVLPFEPTP